MGREVVTNTTQASRLSSSPNSILSLMKRRVQVSHSFGHDVRLF
jgi:hypothetical protein